MRISFERPVLNVAFEDETVLQRSRAATKLGRMSAYPNNISLQDDGSAISVVIDAELSNPANVEASVRLALQQCMRQSLPEPLFVLPKDEIL